MGVGDVYDLEDELSYNEAESSIHRSLDNINFLRETGMMGGAPPTKKTKSTITCLWWLLNGRQLTPVRRWQPEATKPEAAIVMQVMCHFPSQKFQNLMFHNILVVCVSVA